METKKTYTTAGRRNLIQFFRSNPDCQFTPEEICLALNGDTVKGQSSIYRHLSELCAENTVRKFRSEERLCSVYQYVGEGCDCDTHFHAKCLICGKLEHLDLHEEFVNHLLKDHGFSVNCGKSVLYGICKDCKEKENARG